jgi:hypothetical protein
MPRKAEKAMRDYLLGLGTLDISTFSHVDFLALLADEFHP